MLRDYSMSALLCGIHLALEDGCKVRDENTSEQIIPIKGQIRRANWRLSSAANRDLFASNPAKYPP